MSVAAWIVLGLVVVVVLWAVSAYNRLVELRNRIANAFGQIDVQLKRRYDLIPNLVEVARGYLAHEAATLEAAKRRARPPPPAWRRPMPVPWVRWPWPKALWAPAWGG